MGKLVLKDVRLFTGGCDLTTRNNKLELSAEVEEADVTAFRDTGATGPHYKEVLGGLGSAMVSAEGQWEAGNLSTVDDALWAQLGGQGAWTAFPDTADAADLAWIVNGMQSSYQLLGQVGDVAPWKAEAPSTWPAVRGLGLHPPGTARTATGSGTSVQHVAVATGQQLYAALHVLSISGTSTPTLTVRVQSDDATGFASATTRITFSAATSVGSQIARVSGANTDNWYRADWTITGTNPSFLFVVAVGVSV